MGSYGIMKSLLYGVDLYSQYKFYIIIQTE